jgi:uncharacterized membrane protein
MKIYAIAYVATLIAFAGIDFIWLSRMGDVLYRPAMGDMVLDKFRPVPAVVFYCIYAAGLVFLAIRPALSAEDWTVAALNGAVLGLVAYGTYDLTNQATLRNWTTLLTCADLAWGTVLSAASGAIGYLAAVTLTKGV